MSDLPRTEAPDLLQRHCAGDAGAFRALVDTYRDRLLQFFFRLCWDRDRAEDLTQDLFLKLLLASKRYRPEGRLGTYIYRLATNVWIDEYRRARPRPKLYSFDQAVLPSGDTPNAPDVAGPDRQPVLLAAEGEERQRLRAALERLTEPHRLVFELAVYQERPYGEIAELLGIPLGTVKSRMHNAVAALKQMLGAPGVLGAGGAADAAPARDHTGTAPTPRRGGGAL